MSANKTEEQSFGERGSIIALPATGEVTGQFCAIQFIVDTTLTSLTRKSKIGGGDDGTGVTFPAGFVLYGDITAVQVAAGSLVAYLKS